jgi:glycosyl transferase family 87
MKHLKDFNRKESIIFLIFINILLKLAFLFLDVNPSDVQFYRYTGWFLFETALPYQSFNPDNFSLFEIYLNSLHPNGPLNYLFYAVIEAVFGYSVFAIKLPWLISEIIITVYIFKIGNLISSQQKAFLMALVYTLFIPCYYPGILLGCDELITGAFAITALYYFLVKRPMISGLLLSLGIAYKMYPVFFLLPMLIYSKNNGQLKEFIKLCVVAAVTYLVLIFPYLLISPDEFIQYNFSQVNRLITISYGYYVQDSWFYQPILEWDFFISITPHLIFELLVVGGYFVWDFYKSTKTKKYTVKNLFRSLTYYTTMLPVISLSYNYRYFQWILPLILLYSIIDFRFNNLSESEEINQNTKNQYFTRLKYFMVFSFICMGIISIVFIAQSQNLSKESVPFGIYLYNNYLWSFFLVFSIALLFQWIMFRKNSTLVHLQLFGYLQGLTGVFLYYSYEGRNYHHRLEIPFLILSLIPFFMSILLFVKIISNQQLIYTKEKKLKLKD